MGTILGRVRFLMPLCLSGRGPDVTGTQPSTGGFEPRNEDRRLSEIKISDQFEAFRNGADTLRQPKLKTTVTVVDTVLRMVVVS
jgi:hypothetical protein